MCAQVQPCPLLGTTPFGSLASTCCFSLFYAPAFFRTRSASWSAACTRGIKCLFVPINQPRKPQQVHCLALVNVRPDCFHLRARTNISQGRFYCNIACSQSGMFLLWYEITFCEGTFNGGLVKESLSLCHNTDGQFSFHCTCTYLVDLIKSFRLMGKI